MSGKDLKSGFETVVESAQPPHIKDGEFDVMLAQDMTLAQAQAFHLKNWGLSAEFQIEHDVSHIIMGLSAKIHQDEIEYPYQGTYEAEIYTVAAEMSVLDSGIGMTRDPDDAKDTFTKRVHDNFDIYGDEENLNRTVKWALQHHADINADNAIHDHGYKFAALYEQAQQYGIHVSQENDKWIVEVPEGEDDRFWYIDEYENFLPDEIDTVQDFTRFSRPSDTEIEAMYERMRPGIEMVNQRVQDHVAEHGKTAGVSSALRQELGAIKMRDLYEHMQNQATPANTFTHDDLDHDGDDLHP